jgi:hypothetical protein
MFMLPLTAREGRVSANQLGCPVIAQFQTRPRSPTSRAAAFVCLARSSSGDPNDKTTNFAGVLYRH